jgi:hypothetical protein
MSLLGFIMAAVELGGDIIEEIQGKNRPVVILDMEREQRGFDNARRKLIDAIRESRYYKKFTTEAGAMIDSILDELEN